VKESLEEKNAEPVIIPSFIYKIWKTRIKENFNLDIENDILEVLIKTYYVRSTWKWQRAYKNIVDIMVSKGFSQKESINYARSIINIFDTYGIKESR